MGNESLNSKYKRLFEISLQNGAAVGDLGEWVEERWRWVFQWRREFFDWERVLLTNLLQDLNRVKLHVNVKDAWRWLPGSDGGYSVSTAYKAQGSSEVPLCSEVFCKVWDAWVPTKVKVFGWRLAHGRLATLDNLSNRGVVLVGGGNSCFLCHSQGESVNHLFFECAFSSHVWRLCLNWLGISSALPNSCASHLLLFESWEGNKAREKVWRSIWLACVWNIWIHRNNMAFQGAQPDWDKVIECIKSQSWFWIRHLGKGPTVSSSDWYREPRVCLLSVGGR